MMNRVEKGKFDRLPELLFLFGVLVLLGLIFAVNVFHYCSLMNADIASEAVLTEVIWNSKELCPSAWYPSTELRVLSTPNLAAVIFGITQNRVLAMGIACFLMTIGMLCCLYYFMTCAGFSGAQRIGMLLLTLLLPANYDILGVLFLFASYYGIHVIVMFLVASVYVKGIAGAKWNLPLAGVCILLAGVMGIQGMRGILVTFVPLSGIELLRLLYGFYCRGRVREEGSLLKTLRLLLWIGSMILASCAGSFFPGSVSQGASRNLRKGFYKLATEIIPDILEALGFYSMHRAGKLCLVILCIGAVCVLIRLLVQMVQKKEVAPYEWIYLFLWCSPMVTALTAAFSTTESSPRYYFCFVFVIAFSTILLWTAKQKNEQAVSDEKMLKAAGILKIKKAVLLLASAIVMTVNIQQLYLPLLTAKEPPASDEYAVVCYLEDHDYDLAYATFENANTMTVLSGAVRVASVASVENMSICKWLTSTDWYVPNVPYEYPTVYIVTDSEAEQFQKFSAEHQDSLAELTKIGRFTLYVSDYNYSNLSEG